MKKTVPAILLFTLFYLPASAFSEESVFIHSKSSTTNTVNINNKTYKHPGGAQSINIGPNQVNTGTVVIDGKEYTGGASSSKTTVPPQADPDAIQKQVEEELQEALKDVPGLGGEIEYGGVDIDDMEGIPGLGPAGNVHINTEGADIDIHGGSVIINLE